MKHLIHAVKLVGANIKFGRALPALGALAVLSRAFGN